MIYDWLTIIAHLTQNLWLYCEKHFYPLAYSCLHQGWKSRFSFCNFNFQRKYFVDPHGTKTPEFYNLIYLKQKEINLLFDIVNLNPGVNFNVNLINRKIIVANKIFCFHL